MTSVLHEHDGYFENVTVELDASETLVFTRALVKFAEDDSEHSIDRLVATRMVRDLQKIADAPQTVDKDINVRSKDKPQRDCGACEHSRITCRYMERGEPCEYEPKDEPQTDWNETLPCHKCESALSSECTACDGQQYFRTEEGETDCPWK